MTVGAAVAHAQLFIVPLGEGENEPEIAVRWAERVYIRNENSEGSSVADKVTLAPCVEDSENLTSTTKSTSRVHF